MAILCFSFISMANLKRETTERKAEKGAKEQILPELRGKIEDVLDKQHSQASSGSSTRIANQAGDKTKEAIEDQAEEAVEDKEKALDPEVLQQVKELTADSRPVVSKEQAQADQLSQDKKRTRDQKGGQEDLLKPKQPDAPPDKQDPKNQIQDPAKSVSPPSPPVSNPADKAQKNNSDQKDKAGTDSEAKQSEQLSLDKKDGEKASDKTKKEAQVEISGRVSGLKKALSRLLKQSIINAPQTWSLSLFYTYLHAFASFILPKVFCSLGEEWAPPEANKEQVERVGQKTGLVEKPAVCCACFVHLLLVIAIIAIIYFMIHWSEVAWEFLKGLF